MVRCSIRGSREGALFRCDRRGVDRGLPRHRERRLDFVEGRIQVACLNALVVEEDALVEGLVEIPADRIGAIGVGRLRVRHEIQGAKKHLAPYCQYRVRVGQAWASVVTRSD
jgi:hypothetical protein